MDPMILHMPNKSLSTAMAQLNQDRKRSIAKRAEHKKERQDIERQRER